MMIVLSAIAKAAFVDAGSFERYTIASALGAVSSIGAASDTPSGQNLPARIVVLSGFQGNHPPPDAAISGSFKTAAGLFVTRKTEG